MLSVVSAIVILFSNIYGALPFLPPFEQLMDYALKSSALRRPAVVGLFSILAGIVGHFLVNPIVSQLRKDTFSDSQLRQVQTPSQLLGVVERFMYVIAWFMGQAQFIGLWLGLKALGEWSHFKLGEGDVKESGRGQYTVFLFGAALSLVVAFMFIWLAEILV